MANFDSQRMAVMVKENFESTFYQTFEQNQVFLQRVSERAKKTYTEKDITWKLYIAGTPAAGSYREEGSLGINRADLGPLYTTARLTWKLNRVPIRVTGLAQAYSKSSSAIIDAVGENTQDALRQLRKNMNKQLLADGVGNLNGVDADLDATGADITGIQAAWDDGSDVATYAGIDRAVNTWWQSFVLRNPLGILRPITEELMWQVFNELQGHREGNITDITCSLGLVTQVGLLLGQDRRFNFSGGETPKYSGGFTGVTFNGTEIMGVPFYQRNRMDFWDAELLRLNVLLDFNIEQRDPGDFDAMTLFAKTYAQLCYKNSYHSASIRDLAES